MLFRSQVDWPTVRANCATPDRALAAWKVTQGVASTDAFKDRNRTETVKAGFRWRFGYHWLTAVVDPIKQADWFLTHFLAVASGEGIILDAEEAGITADQCLAWCERVEAVTGRPVAVYTGVYVAGGSIWRDTRLFNGQRIRWLAAYIGELRMKLAALPFEADVWQGDGGATGRFPGVTGGVDLNKVYNPIMLDLACGITAPPPVPSTPITDDGDEPVNICTNAEQFFNDKPNVVKFLVTSTGKLRHLSEPEWIARGSEPGVPLTNAQISTLGTV